MYRRRRWTFWTAFGVATGAGAWTASTIHPLYRARASFVAGRPATTDRLASNKGHSPLAFVPAADSPETHLHLLAREDLHSRAREGVVPPREIARYRMVRVERAPASESIDVVVEAVDPKQAAALATRIVTLHLSEMEEARTRVIRSQAEFLAEERRAAQAQLQRIEKRLFSLEEAGAGISNPIAPGEVAALRASLSALGRRREAKSREIAQLRAKLRRPTDTAQASLQAPAGAGQDPGATESRGTSDPEKLKTLLTELRTLEDETRDTRGELGRALAAKEASHKHRAEISRLQQQLETARVSVRVLTERWVGAQSAAKGLSSWATVRAASVPQRPFWPEPRSQALVVLTGAFFSGLAAMVLHERFWSFVTSAADAERAGLSLLGRVIPRTTFQGAASSAAQPSTCEETVSGLEFAGIPHRVRVLLVLEPDSGMSGCAAAAIAAALAAPERNVVLVEADLRGGLRSLEAETVDSRLGLSQVLAGVRDDADTVRPTDISGLWYLPAGPIPPNPVDLLRGAAFTDLIGRLNERFDVVVFKAHADHERPDALHIVSRMDGVLIAAPGRRARIPWLREWGDRVRQAGGAPIGMLLVEPSGHRGERDPSTIGRKASSLDRLRPLN